LVVSRDTTSGSQQTANCFEALTFFAGSQPADGFLNTVFPIEDARVGGKSKPSKTLLNTPQKFTASTF
jgi:hypothetical protein